MYIQPHSNIKLLHNVPLDDTYEHTIYFDSASSQYSYFAGLTKYNLTNYTYQRVQKGVARVGFKADLIYDCNYLMFQNSSFGSKWFYAFIKNVEYVNNECSDVTFEIDVIQTWFFDFSFGQCFVEREHTVTDNIGEHIEPESVATGEYVFNNYEKLLSPVTEKDMSEMVVCLAIVDVVGQTAQGELYDGVYGAAELWVYDSTDVAGIDRKVGEFTEAPDKIIGMYMFPKFLIGSIPDSHKLAFSERALKTPVNHLTAPRITDTLDGYRPKNRKLYTYPYNFCHVDNANGSELNLRYEFFENNKPVFEITGTITQPVNVMLRPCSYKGVAGYDQLGGYTTLNTESLTLGNYPMCSWNIDAYQAWVAQNAIPLAISSGANLANTVMPSYNSKGNIQFASEFEIGKSVINEVANVASQMYSASIAADICKGTFNNGGVNVANKSQQFYWGRCSVNKVQAKMIDDFFNKFGYSCGRVKYPNTHSRPHWNYVKTIGCIIHGSVPADDSRKICSIFDNGITFWKEGNQIGNYTLDNSPT